MPDTKASLRMSSHLFMVLLHMVGNVTSMVYNACCGPQAEHVEA